MFQRFTVKFFVYCHINHFLKIMEIAGKSQGYRRRIWQSIRPAPGYPACPDHTEKQILWDFIDAEKNTGISLTESFAMYPAASVCGLYFSHPEAKYFSVGRIGKDQVEDYGKRKDMKLRDIEKWVRVNLNYKESWGA